MARNFDRSALDPNQIAVHGFGSGFRGYDQDEVRAYLQRLAAVMQELLDEQAELLGRVAAAEERAARPPELDEDQLTAALGAETARVLSSARQAAADIRVNADSTATRTLMEANEQASAVRAGADQYADGVRAATDEQQARLVEASERARADADAEAAATRAAADTYAEGVRAQVTAEAEAIREAAESHAQGVRTEADASVSALKAEADGEAARLRTEAEQVLVVKTAEAEAEVERIRAAASEVGADAEREAEVTREAARTEGRQMVAEAQQVRERMLKDLARRRKGARQQLEQLGAARERLLEAYAVVRQTVEAATSELLIALPEARFAAERAGRRARGEAEATLEELEAEIEAAHETDLADADVDDSAPPEGAIEGFTERAEDQPPVRIIGAQVAGAADLAPSDAASDRDPASSPPEPEAEVEAAMAVEDGGDERVEPSAADNGESDHRLLAPQSTSPEVEVDAATADGPAPEPGEPDVTSLFERIRAGRAEPVLRDDAPAAEAAGGVEAAGAVDVGVEEDGPKPGPGAVLSLLERRDHLTEEVEHRLARKLKRVLADEQSKVLDSVRRSRGRSDAEAVLPDDAAHGLPYAEAAIEDLFVAARAGAELADGTRTEPLRTKVDDLASQLADDVTSQLRPRLERCFEGTDGDEDELTNMIRSCYREWRAQRIVEATRHFVLAAFTRGQYEATPPDALLQWVVDSGGSPCPDAEDNALAGAVRKGQTFPTGHCLPPAHAGCRCLVVPAPEADRPDTGPSDRARQSQQTP